MRAGRTLLTLVLVPALLSGCASAPHLAIQVGHASPLEHAHVSNRQRTEHEVERLLSEVRLPPGAHRRSSAPARELRGAGGGIAGSNIIRRHEWWTSASSVRDVLRYVRQHGPRGCDFDTSGSSNGPNQRTVHDIGCFGRSTRHTYEPEVDVEAVSTRTGSAIRADVEAIWMPTRPASSYVRHARGARVLVERHRAPGRRGSPTVRRALSTGSARRLARVLDRQIVAPPVTISCPAGFFGVDDRLAFSTPRGTVTVTVELTGCPGIYVKAPQHPATALQGAAALDAAVRHVLHLPKRYDVG